MTVCHYRHTSPNAVLLFPSVCLSPAPGQAQSQQTSNMNQLSQLFMNQNQAQGLGGLSSSDIQRVLGQQQGNSNASSTGGFQVPNAPQATHNQANTGTATAGLLHRPEQFTNQDRLDRSGLSVVSESSSAKGNIISDGTNRTNGGNINPNGAQPSVGHRDARGVDPAYPMTDIEYPGQNDCMFGRGGGTSNHIGYVLFRLERPTDLYRALVRLSSHACHSYTPLQKH